MLEELERPDAPALDGDAFAEAFGERLDAALDLGTWRKGEDLAALYQRLQEEVAAAMAQEARVREPFRAEVLARLGRRPDAPPGAGAYKVEVAEIERVHHGLLFNGGVEACDASIRTVDALPLTVYQVGIGLVAYQGSECTWVQRLYRRDLRMASADPTEEAIALLERRALREQSDSRDRLSRIASRAIAAYVQRLILLREARARWRLGRGSPAPFELVTGSGSMDLMVQATRLIEELVCGHQRFVFVPSSTSQRLLRTIGHALNPLEYAVVHRLSDGLDQVVRGGDWLRPVSVDTTVDGRRLTPAQWVRRFCAEVASQVVVGVYRASAIAPPQVFYAHVDHAHTAARIALADSVLLGHRGSPFLLDLAGHVCATSFGADSLSGALEVAYTEAGAPLRYFAGLGYRA